MTVIIGSLFLPYTVQFEVGATDAIAQPHVPKGPHEPAPVAAKLAPSSSILPSLSIANSRQQTPLAASPGPEYKPEASADAQDFFYKNHRFKKQTDTPLADGIADKLGPHYIQPRARYNNGVPPSSVVDPKNKDDGSGLLGLKMNRSTNNLAGLAGSHTNLAALSHASTNRTRSSLSKPHPGLTLHTNSSTSSLAVAEEDDHQASNPSWNNEYASDVKLAPFGGFSNPGDLLDQPNIFETAPWTIKFSHKGNVSTTKAVKLSAEHNIVKSRKWVGTISMPSDEVPDHIRNDIAGELRKGYNSEAVFPNDATFQGHYNSFCKQILWPTFHYQIPDDPKSKAFEDHSWGHYQLLNQLVADKIVEVYLRENGNANPEDPENMIWIHDYHLLLVPLMVRQKLPEVKIGLFLHVSFPSSEVFRCFAQRTEILKGMLGANCISFQTDEYVRHFLQTCNRLLLADVNDLGITYEGNFTMTNTIPVGIDSNSIIEMVQSESVTEWRQLIKERWPDQNLIVSRDKLDKLRGIKQKLLAYEKFLNSNPEYIDTTVLIEICIGSSHDPHYESEIMQIVARINSLPENISVSQPVVLLQKDIEFEQYLALQCEADVFVVSSMREGLNLTSHEFITATSEKKSPLILSEFTGSSQLLDCGGHGALLINPWDIKTFSETFKKLLTMDKKEKETRWTKCNDIVKTQDSMNWVASCLQSINESYDLNKRTNLNKLKPFNTDVFGHFYRQGKEKNRLFFLNFETAATTLSVGDKKPTTNSITTAKSAYTEPSRLISLLNGLLEDPKNKVYIISFLKRTDLDRLYRTYPNLGLIAENGGYIKVIGSQKWISMVDETEIQGWIAQVTQLVESKVERLPGSHCEVEDCTVRFHTGKSFIEDRERTLDAMGDCIQHVNDVFQDSDGVHASLIRDVVIIQQNQLALKALKFINDYYSQDNSGVDAEQLIQNFQVKGLAGAATNTPIRSKSIDISSLGELATSTSTSEGLNSIFVAGATTLLDEPSYEFVNRLKENGLIQTVSTVAILGDESDVRTSANFGVNGINELLRVLSEAKSIV
ncbi:glycosyltransferase family 20 protein [Suhomyces tanzawaensis NRRL Y-17324]|uniref:Glycosyltransferase family 20 protein n=1 Tax=Suhomyces tanzawaensis NRRL Y-17324 TaxID=984487 RepID=A0A1E4SSH9_9ASCO|nr:glycosyltransferase family 20 protein [Suhomyces tanzawaensis NRRL Y-17324]ODV82470.1 glycosyltransferase family 20 protein [Suhomyces tanzawaensis NRRL Y-17324]